MGNERGSVVHPAGRRSFPVVAPRGAADDRLWLDIGAQDAYFQPTDEQLASALHIHLHTWPGGHNSAYWNAHWNDHLGFYAHALATCR